MGLTDSGESMECLNVKWQNCLIRCLGHKQWPDDSWGQSEEKGQGTINTRGIVTPVQLHIGVLWEGVGGEVPCSGGARRLCQLKIIKINVFYV